MFCYVFQIFKAKNFRVQRYKLGVLFMAPSNIPNNVQPGQKPGRTIRGFAKRIGEGVQSSMNQPAVEAQTLPASKKGAASSGSRCMHMHKHPLIRFSKPKGNNQIDKGSRKLTVTQKEPTRKL